MGDFGDVSLADWRALVDEDLHGASFEKVLVHRSTEGLATQPLYIEASATPLVDATERFRICMRHTSVGSIGQDLDAGADALWLVPATVKDQEQMVAATAGFTGRVFVEGEVGVVSTLRYHEAGAEAAEELALALSSGAAALRVGISASSLTFRVSVGRDTFSELCKLRALRVLWDKVLVASGDPAPVPITIHAVSSSRTLTVRDAATNMLRTTTQVFAAIVGGADFVTPTAFDEATGEASELAHRVARNTGLILRDESQLGRVVDAAGGSYYFESFTDALAREAWMRFCALERDGGVRSLEASGELARRLATAWQEREARIATRAEPIVGVSEFAALGESAPAPGIISRGGLPRHRDAEAFESLRARIEAHTPPVEVALVSMGPIAEHRARVAYCSALFATAGIVTKEAAAGDIACLCGTDERYSAEGLALARALKEAGCKRLLVAGRPGALEAAWREAGVDDFVFMGCDVVATFQPIAGDA